MKSHKIILSAISVAAITAVMTVIGVNQAGSAALGDGQHLEGAWLIKTTIDGEPPFEALATLNSDGTVIESLIDPTVSDAHGAWVRTGDRRFAITVVYLRSDGAGGFLGMAKIRATFVLSASLTEGTGQFHTDVFDANGNLINSFEGTNQAKRILAEPL